MILLFLLQHDYYVLTLCSVLTPTVSRKFTGLRSRMMALGSEGSRSSSTSMIETSFWCSKCFSSCSEGDLGGEKKTSYQMTNKRLKEQNVCRLGRKMFTVQYLGFTHQAHSILLELFFGFLGFFLFVPLFFGLQFLLCRQDLCNVNTRLK